MTTAPAIHIPKSGRNEVRVGVTKDKVWLRVRTPERHVGLELEWRAALEMGNALWRFSRHAESVLKDNPNGGAFDAVNIGRQTTVMLRGTICIVHVAGHDVINAEWPVARGIGGHLIHHAHRAETFAKAHLVIDDQALLIRKGVGIGLVTDPVMLREAEKEAQHNTALRRYIRIPHYAEQVGFPQLKRPRRA